MKATLFLLLFIRVKFITLQSKSLPDFTPWRQQRGHKMILRYIVRSVLLVKETGLPGENYRTAA